MIRTSESIDSNRSSVRIRPASLLPLVVAAACASAGGAGGGRASVPYVPSYSARTDSTWAAPAAMAPYYTAVTRAASQTSHALSPDSSLALSAQAIAERIAADGAHRTPAIPVIQALSWAAGVIDPLPAVVVARGSAGTGADIANAAVTQELQNDAHNRVGIGRAVGANGEQFVVVMMSQRRLSLQLPVPRTLTSGARLIVNATLASGLRNPELAVTHPDGHTERFPLGEGPQFVGQMPVRVRGTYQIEVVAEGEGGATIIANFPVYVDTTPPTPSAATAQTNVTETPPQVEQSVMALVNEARRAAGRAPVALMPALSQVARLHSQDMAQNHFVAHNSRTNGTPGDRLRRGNLSSGVVLENVARGYNARELHEGLMASPGHRSNLLSEHVTHVGIGAALEAGPGGALLLTEDFIEVNAQVDPAAASQQLLEMINRDRTRRGAAALQSRPQLAEVANTAARAFFEGTPRPTQQSVVNNANTAVNRFGLIFRRVSVLAMVVTRPTDAGGLDPLRDPAIGSIGIGVAQGARPDAPPNAVFVVYVLGYPR